MTRKTNQTYPTQGNTKNYKTLITSAMSSCYSQSTMYDDHPQTCETMAFKHQSAGWNWDIALCYKHNSSIAQCITRRSIFKKEEGEWDFDIYWCKSHVRRLVRGDRVLVLKDGSKETIECLSCPQCKTPRRAK